MAEGDSNTYIRGYLEKKSIGKWTKYWCVIKGTMMFFFTDPNTHIPENFASSISLGPETKTNSIESKKDVIFDVKSGKSNHRFKCENNLRRSQWLFAISLSSRLQPPAALPGEENFDQGTSSAPNPYVSRSELLDQVPAIPRGEAHLDPDYHDVVDTDKCRTTFQPSGVMHRKLSYTLPSRPQMDRKKLMRRHSTDGIEMESPYDVLNLTDSSWFIESLSRQQAENLLHTQPVGTFLVRKSETARLPGCYTLSIKRGDRIFHHKIETHNLGLIIKGHEQYKFKDLSKLVKFFASSQKDIKVRAYSSKSESNSSIEEFPEYEVLDGSEDVFSKDKLGPRSEGDGYEEPADELLSKEVIKLHLEDKLNPNDNQVPLPAPPSSHDDAPSSYVHMSPSTEKKDPLPTPPSYLHMSPSTDKRFVPTTNDADGIEYLLMEAKGGPSSEGVGIPEYLNMNPKQNEPSSDASYVNMPPPLPDCSEKSPPLPPRNKGKNRSKSLYNPPRRCMDQDPSRPPELPIKQSEQPRLPPRSRPPMRKAHTLSEIPHS